MEALDNFKHDYDIVLIDSAPMSMSSDAQLIGSLAKGAVLVLQKNHSRAKNAEQLSAAIKLAGAECLGVILTEAIVAGN
jgi:Mrp family chromosome partitioning ATPase